MRERAPQAQQRFARLGHVDEDRVQRGDGGQRIGLARRDQVAHGRQRAADPAGDRRPDGGPGEVDLGRPQRPLVLAHGRLRLAGGGHGIVDCLLRDAVAEGRASGPAPPEVGRRRRRRARWRAGRRPGRARRCRARDRSDRAPGPLCTSAPSLNRRACRMPSTWGRTSAIAGAAMRPESSAVTVDGFGGELDIADLGRRRGGRRLVRTAGRHQHHGQEDGLCSAPGGARTPIVPMRAPRGQHREPVLNSSLRVATARVTTSASGRHGDNSDVWTCCSGWALTGVRAPLSRGRSPACPHTAAGRTPAAALERRCVVAPSKGHSASVAAPVGRSLAVLWRGPERDPRRRPESTVGMGAPAPPQTTMRRRCSRHPGRHPRQPASGLETDRRASLPGGPDIARDSRVTIPAPSPLSSGGRSRRG